MATTKVVLLVQFRIVGGAVLRCEIGLQLRGSCRERAADDLLHGPRMQINTWRERGLAGRHVEILS